MLARVCVDGARNGFISQWNKWSEGAARGEEEGGVETAGTAGVGFFKSM